MKVIILAAGMGTRLKPLTNHIPKTMITVGNQTLIENIIQGLVDIQLSEIAIITGYQHEVLETFLKRRFPTVRLQFIYNDQYSVKDNIYSFSLAEEFVGNEEMLCICSDIYCEPQLLLRAVQAPFDILMVDDTKEIPSRAMKVRVNREGYIAKISKELSVEESKGEIVGISKISATNTAFIFERIATYLDMGIVNVWWPYAINDALDQIKLRPWSTDGIGWVNVNTFDDLKEAMNIANH